MFQCMCNVVIFFIYTFPLFQKKQTIEELGQTSGTETSRIEEDISFHNPTLAKDVVTR